MTLSSWGKFDWVNVKNLQKIIVWRLVISWKKNWDVVKIWWWQSIQEFGSKKLPKKFQNAKKGQSLSNTPSEKCENFWNIVLVFLYFKVELFQILFPKLWTKTYQKRVRNLQNHKIWSFITSVLLRLLSWNFHQILLAMSSAG